MHSGMKLRVTVFALAVSLVMAASAGAQQIRFTDFSSLANLQLNGSFQANWQSQKVLRISPGPFPTNVGHPGATSTYFNLKQPITAGFTTYFSFEMHPPTSNAGRGDGMSFLIQNSTFTDTSMGASGAGLTAVGAGRNVSGAGGLGYAGIPASLAVEFDISQNPWDPTGNHVAVQSCGTDINTPVHLPGTFTIGQNTHVTSCLVAPSAITPNALADGNSHQVVIEYTPPTGHSSNGTLAVWVDPDFIVGTHTPKSTSPPIVSIPYSIAPIADANGAAWVGFTASQSIKATVQDVLAWEFTPHTPVVIQELINNDGTTNEFTFGGHVAKVTYPANSNPNGDYMTVLATPTDRNTFYHTRLQGTQFQNELCVTYLETGGNCMVYSVTCQASDRTTPVDCPTTQLDQILLSTSYYTADPVTNDNADYLKADPIGSNNWITICNARDADPPCFQPNVFDGTTSGKGHDLSDLVATFMVFSHPVGQKSVVAEPPKPQAVEPKRNGLQ